MKFCHALQYRKQCLPDSKDRRYEICSCAKHLNLNCDYRNDINEVSLEKQDPAVRSIKLTMNGENTRVYFPNLNYFSIKYEVINMRFFNFIPFFAFYNEYHLKEDQTPTYTLINLEYSSGGDSYELEFNEEENEMEPKDNYLVEKKIIDGDREAIMIDSHAFSGINVHKILIEGDYTMMKFHAKAIINANINELQVNCFTKINQKNAKECVIDFFNEKQLYSIDEKNDTRSLELLVEKKDSVLNELKFYGITIQQHDKNSSSNEWNIDSIPNINELKVLHIINTKTRANGFQKFYTHKPQDLLKLEDLTLRDNIIDELSEEFLMRNKFMSLKTLDLSNNLISTIELNAFKHLAELETLDLSNNKLNYLSSAAFNGLKSLKNLILKSNQISNLVPNQFASLQTLIFLDLSSNRISNLEATNFNNLTSLNTIQLEFNPFERISSDSFKFISDIKIIDLTSKFNKDWFYFDNNDICLLKEFKCKNTNILLSTEQNCNCFLYYANLINSIEQEKNGHNDNMQLLKNCNVSCNHEQLLSKCFNDNDSYKYSCLYNLLKPVNVPTTSLLTTTASLPSKMIEIQTTQASDILSTVAVAESTILNTIKKFDGHNANAEPSDNNDQSNLKTSPSENSDDEIHKNYVPSVRTLELTNLVHLSLFLSSLSLILLFIFTVVFSCMHSKYRKHATYNIVPRVID